MMDDFRILVQGLLSVCYRSRRFGSTVVLAGRLYTNGLVLYPWSYFIAARFRSMYSIWKAACPV